MNTRIDKILIANRGEIAVRIARTCREMGIATVAVYSDADADAMHVHMADEAVCLGPPAASASYLVIDKILAAATLTGADAIHPGYGFLAENAAFARACADRELTFIGPSAEVIRVLGSKRESKRVVAEAGVPVIPGYDGDAQDDAVLSEKAREIGFPVLIKASAGGGGKGMRVVRAEEELADAIAAAKREAKGAFGDDMLLIETYIDSPRHVEFQILGDNHGTLVHLFERECSIQRRHQKIIEETPSPALDDALRSEMGAAAVTIGKAVGYVNAGTVEFILAPDRRFYFLEVNTRLQVEHPVTECVTGIDLVRQQIRVARGERLEVETPRINGAAIECRLYAEDADGGFLPVTGTLADWHVPEHVARETGLRVDTGIRTGDAVSIYYDPMLAKLICHAPTRADAVHKMIYSLRAMSVQGVTTNRAFLIRVLSHDDFLAGNTHTHFLTEHAVELAVSTPPAANIRAAMVAATLYEHEYRRAQRAILPELEPGFRNNRFSDECVRYTITSDGDERTAVVYYRNLGDRRFSTSVTLAGVNDGAPVDDTVRVASFGDANIEIEHANGWLRRSRVVRDEARDRVYVHSRDGDFELIRTPRFPVASAEDIEGACVAPMPGKVIDVLVTEGQTVNAGDTLVILEAMKMEHRVTAPEDGVIERLPVTAGEQVESDTLLAVVTPA